MALDFSNRCYDCFRPGSLAISLMVAFPQAIGSGVIKHLCLCLKVGLDKDHVMTAKPTQSVEFPYTWSHICYISVRSGIRKSGVRHPEVPNNISCFKAEIFILKQKACIDLLFFSQMTCIVALSSTLAWQTSARIKLFSALCRGERNAIKDTTPAFVRACSWLPVNVPWIAKKGGRVWYKWNFPYHHSSS